MLGAVKTTIDIPESLYRKAKIRAFERGTSLRTLVVDALAREIEAPRTPSKSSSGSGFFARRRVLPEYEALMKAGGLAGGADSTQVISEDRSAREDSLL
jgi:hypothetical protein